MNLSPERKLPVGRFILGIPASLAAIASSVALPISGKRALRALFAPKSRKYDNGASAFEILTWFHGL